MRAESVLYKWQISLTIQLSNPHMRKYSGEDGTEHVGAIIGDSIGRLTYWKKWTEVWQW